MNCRPANFQSILDLNKNFIIQFESSKLMKLLDEDTINQPKNRDRLLQCLLVFSTQFQNTVMLRVITTQDCKFLSLAQEHLDEEYGHPALLKDHITNKSSIWDPILDATTAWFTMQMLSSDNIQKTLLVHLVLEASANVFFKKALAVLDKNNLSDYFKVHVDNDEHHENMGLAPLEGLREAEYETLILTQERGWKMLLTACNRIAELSVSTN